jgi:hypothetical protein
MQSIITNYNIMSGRAACLSEYTNRQVTKRLKAKNEKLQMTQPKELTAKDAKKSSLG